MSKSYNRIAQAITAEPWAITREYLNIIEAVVDRAESGEKLPNADVFDAAAKQVAKDKEVYVLGNTVVVPVLGVISPRITLFQMISGGTSIAELTRNLDKAVSMPQSTVILNFDSPGGSVSGVPEFADVVDRVAKRSGKTLVACCNGMMCSAAYWIASKCDELYATKASVIGSIGVIASFFDSTRRSQNEGLDPITIRSGELKGSGNGHITPNQMASMQKRVDELYAMFKAEVRMGRPAIDIEAVSTGETWLGEEAKRLKLIDGVATLEQVVEKYS